MREIDFGKPLKRPVTRFISLFCSFLIIAEATVLSIFIITGGALHMYQMLRDSSTRYITFYDCLFLGLGVLGAMLFVFCNKFFEWHLNPRIVVDNENRIVFSYHTAVGVFGNDIDKYTISKISNYSVNTNSIVVRGEIKVKTSGSKEKSAKSMKITNLYTSDLKCKVCDLLEWRRGTV